MKALRHFKSGLCRKAPGLARFAAAVLGACLVRAALLAQSAPSTLLWYDSDPFVDPRATRLEAVQLPDWISRASGPVVALKVEVEHFDPTTGLAQPTTATAAPAPPGATFPLINQYAADLSVYQLDATFGPPGDAGGNALEDSWEQRFFHRTGIDPGADADGDGFTNLAEREAGTDPTDPKSQPAIPGILGRWSADGDASDRTDAHPAVWVGPEAFAEGRVGQAFALAAGRHLRIPDAPDLQPRDGLTMAAWVRLDRLDCNPSPVLVRPGSTPGQPAFALSLHCQGARLQLGTATAIFNNGPVFTPSTNVWYHLAATWDGAEFRFYLNGRPAFASRVNGGLGPLDLVPGRDLLIGHDGHTGYLDGRVDEVVLAGRALTSEEVRWLAGGNDGPRGLPGDTTLVVERSDQTVWRVEVDGSRAAYLTHGFDARLSGDRRWLAFRREPTSPGNSAAEELWLRDLLTGDERRVFAFDIGRQWESFDWASDNAAVVVANAFTRRIERRLFADGSRTLLVDTNPLGGAPYELAVDRTRGRLAWFHSTFNVPQDAPWVAGAHGTFPQAVTDTRRPDFFSRHHLPSWSPDGTRLALKSGRNLLTVAPDGGSRVNVTTFKGVEAEPFLNDSPPAWTADAGQLATVAAISGPGTEPRLFFVRADGSGQSRDLALEGAAPVAVVFAGGAPSPAPLRIEAVLVAPTEPGAAPELQFEAPASVVSIALETMDRLGGTWTAQPAFLRDDGGRRRFVLRLDPNAPARFFRLRRDGN